MFIGFSKTIAKFGGFRLGVGFRITKKNILWVSLIVMFVSLFKLMWYMMLLCGWLIYAMCYGIFWCIKQIIKATSKSPQSGNRNSQATIKYNNVTDDYYSNNESNNTPPSNKHNNKLSNIIRWIFGVFFALFIIVSGFHYSSIFFILSAFLMLPLDLTKRIQEKYKLKTFIIILISIFLFFFGIFTSPSADTNEPQETINTSHTEAFESVETKTESSFEEAILNTESSFGNEIESSIITEIEAEIETKFEIDNEIETELETQHTPHSYKINYTASIIENNSVGDTWEFGVSHNSEKIESNCTITISSTDTLTLLLYASEEDKSNNDYGDESITLDKLAVGENKSVSVIVKVIENDGRYSGNIAKWEFVITYERIS